MRLLLPLVVLGLALVPACSNDGPSIGDQGLDDAGRPDANSVDMGLPDDGTTDVGLADVGQPDLGQPDLGPPDLGPGEQNCLDGLDDDMDGNADCADPDCDTVVMCVPAAGVEWSIPGLFQAGATTSACSGVFDTEAFLGNGAPTGDAAACSPCTCSSPTFTGCLSAPRVCQKNGGCAGTCTAGLIEGTGCIESPGASTHHVPGDGFLAEGTCSVTAAVATSAPPSWGREGRVCTPAGAAVGCQAAEVCVPRPANPSALCVFGSGDVTCPTGYDDSREVFFDEFADSRGCSTCQCWFTAGNCVADFTAYSAASCGGTETLLSLNSCMAGDPASYRIENVRPTGTPTCGVPSGGIPVGAVTGAIPSTVCCAPAP